MDAGFYCCKCAHVCPDDACCMAHPEYREWLSGEELARIAKVGTMGPVEWWEEMGKREVEA